MSVGLLAALSWPALWNGQPLFFADTTAYVRGADAGFEKLLHQPSIWSDASSPASGPGARPSFSSVEHRTVLAGRSIYYGAFLWLGSEAGRLWPVVFIQALVVLVAIAGTLQTAGILGWPQLGIVTSAVALLTPLPFFVSYLMPDVFAGTAILAVANLLAGLGRRPRMGRGMGWGMGRALAGLWWLLLTVSLLVHASHLLVVTGLACLLGAVLLSTALLRSGERWRSETAGYLRPLGLVAAAIAVAAAGEAAFQFATTRLVGAPPLRPPFLMARLIADGPGYRYLRASCPAAQLAICDFLPRLPALMASHTDVPPSDEILWNTGPQTGVFGAADWAARRRLSSEQFRFVAGAFRYDPAGVAGAWARDAFRQLGLVGLEEFAIGEGEKGFFLTHVPPTYLMPLRQTRLWQQGPAAEGWLREWSRVTSTFVWALPGSLLLLFTIQGTTIHGTTIHSTRPRAPFGATFGRMQILGVAIALGVLLNGILCGMMSTPHHRYQARVIWLLPLVGLVLLGRSVAVSQRRREHPVGLWSLPAFSPRRADGDMVRNDLTCDESTGAELICGENTCGENTHDENMRGESKRGAIKIGAGR